MRSRHLHAALLKSAFEMHPYSPGEMAGYGGLAGGLLGAGTGALTGLIGTESGSPERRKAMARRALIGLLAGGGIGAATGGIASANARGNMLDTFDQKAMESAEFNPLKLLIVQQLAQQTDKAPFQRVLENPEMLDVPVAKKTHDMISQALKETKMSPMSTGRILVGQNPLLLHSGMNKELMDSFNKTPTNVNAEKGDVNAAWNVIKSLGLVPNAKK